MPSTDNSSVEIVSDSSDTEDDIEIEMSLRRSTGVERNELPATGPSSSQVRQVSESHPRDMAQRSANGNEAVDQGGTTDPQRLHLQLMETLHQLTQKVDAPHQDRACCVSAKSKLKDAEEELKKLRKDKQQMAEEIGRLKSDLSIAQSKLRSQEVILDERSCALATERSFRQQLEEQLNTKAGDILVSGSSIIRDLDEALYKDTKVIAVSGALPKDVTKVLKEEHAKK